MYAEYYNLKAMPFQLTPDSHFFFDSQEHKRAFAHLAYGLAQEEGFVVITGEIGAGKTMLVERLWSQLDTGQYRAARVQTTQLSGSDLLQMVAHGFGLHADYPDKAGVIHALDGVFGANRAAGKRCLLVVDEAQNLPIGALEELRMLSNLTVQGKAPFQGLLLGQPQFRRMLADASLEQLQQRILASYHLGPLTATETREYVHHRLLTAGWNGDPAFDEDALVAVHQHSGGIPRRINTLCSRLLLSGFIEEVHRITERMVITVADELGKDLNAGEPVALDTAPLTESSTKYFDERLRKLEHSVTRHDRALKLTLEITARLIEAQR
jgi:putative secretion ATPase (PEP-CTERM system associated)